MTDTETQTTPVQAATKIVLAIAECIKGVDSIPSGNLYGLLCGRLSLHQYEGVLQILVKAGLIEVKPSHLIVWIGPK